MHYAPQPSATPELFIVPTPDPVSPPPSNTQRIFYGPFGLRAGWSLLIYFAIIASILTGVSVVQKHMLARDKAAKAGATQAASPTTPKPPNKPAAPAPQPLKPILIVESVIFATFLLITRLMALIERRPFSSYGLGDRNIFKRFFTGACWGLAMLSMLIGILRVSHLLVFDERLLHGSAILGFGAVQFLAFLLVGLQEEYVFRGYTQFTLTRGMVSVGNLISPKHARAIGFWIASIITSAFFFLAHAGNGGETKMGLVMVFLAGITFVIALWRTGSLWWAIGFHTAWDWAQSFLYGVPDSGGLEQGRLFATHAIGNPLFSGGTVGPEGSLFVIPTLALVIIVLLLTKSSPQPPLETLPTNHNPLDAQETNPLIA